MLHLIDHPLVSAELTRARDRIARTMSSANG